MWAVFKILKDEKICSTPPLENGKLNANLLRIRTLGHLKASAVRFGTDSCFTFEHS